VRTAAVTHLPSAPSAHGHGLKYIICHSLYAKLEYKACHNV